jgi:hypothetical protein
MLAAVVEGGVEVLGQISVREPSRFDTMPSRSSSQRSARLQRPRVVVRFALSYTSGQRG